MAFLNLLPKANRLVVASAPAPDVASVDPINAAQTAQNSEEVAPSPADAMEHSPGHFASPSHPTPESSDDPLAQIRSNAAIATARMLKDFPEFAEERVYCVEQFVVGHKPNPRPVIEQLFGAWLGEFLVETVPGASWIETGQGWRVDTVAAGPVDPFAEVGNAMVGRRNQDYLARFVYFARTGEEL